MTSLSGSKTDSSLLPLWDLGDLYSNPQDSAIEGDFSQAEKKAEKFREHYLGKLASLGGKEFLKAILDYQDLGEILGGIESYAELLYSSNLADPEIGRFHQTVKERSNEISLKLLFFRLEINRLEDADLNAKLAHGPLQRFKPWLEIVRSMRSHQLSDDIEKLLQERGIVSRQAWVRLFDETMADMRFDVGNETLTLNEALDRLFNPDRSKRQQAATALSLGFKSKLRIFSLITNTLAKEKEIDDKWRSFAKPISARNLANQVEDEVVVALVNAVRSHYPNLSHRYYRMKASWLGLERLEYWDRNAPLPEDRSEPIAWEEAVKIVSKAYRDFSPDLAEIGNRFFAHSWIDVGPRPGKTPGAFAHPTVPSKHPYLLLNYHGKIRDVMTLAHELGHGIHQVLAAPQGLLLADTPLTLAETASVFGEMLTFQALLQRETDFKKRRILLAGKIEDMLNTVIRQIAMHEFETRLHKKRRDGELTPSEISKIWLECQREALGDGVRLEEDSDYSYYWAYIPHFIHSPFYVYAYAFGDCLVNSLYATYRKNSAGFPEKYKTMLAAGGAKRHRELLAPFGLDATRPEFWAEGLALIGQFIDELETMG